MLYLCFVILLEHFYTHKQQKGQKQSSSICFTEFYFMETWFQFFFAEIQNTVKPHDLEPRLLEFLTISNWIVGPEFSFYYFYIKNSSRSRTTTSRSRTPVIPKCLNNGNFVSTDFIICVPKFDFAILNVKHYSPCDVIVVIIFKRL